ncbi:hypothetical protein BH10ACI4_BH10ACI4_21520 [soil metagenome]
MLRTNSLLIRFAVLGLSFLARANAQTTTNQGTDFYLGFMQNYAGTPNLRLFFTGNTATSGTVEIPGLSFSTPFVVNPGSITSVVIPGTAESQTSDVVDFKGIHVTSLAPVTVYGLNQITATTDAFLGLPAPLLGTDHIVLGYSGGAGGVSEFQVVGTQDGTMVTITPTVAATGHAAGIPYTIFLNRLQTYQLQASGATTDLSGTLISTSAPVALFGGAVCTNIPNNNYVACDHVVEQIPATGAWGQSFLTVPLATRTGGDTFRVIARDAGTTVTVDGALVATLGRAQIYQAVLSSGSNHSITTSSPALVAQYSNSSSYDGVTSDPFMMLISPTEQFQTSYTVTTPSSNPVAFTNFINVVSKTTDVSTCKIDGGPISTFTGIGATGYSGAKIPVAIGTHNLSCPSGFGVYTYGFASFDSYGYPGGLGIKFIAAPRCDVNGDGRIDSRDINLIFSARNTPASSAEDKRDADGDLQITVADARVCQQKCTQAGCAVN